METHLCRKISRITLGWLDEWSGYKMFNEIHNVVQQIWIGPIESESQINIEDFFFINWLTKVLHTILNIRISRMKRGKKIKWAKQKRERKLSKELEF